MSYPINGFHDFYTILSNERKIGGAIEAEEIKIRSGEVYHSPVITNIDYTGSTFYSIGFVTIEGIKMIVNVSDISSIKAPMHKKVSDIENCYFKEIKIAEKLKYLKRLIKADQGANTTPFVQEASKIINDIGLSNISEDLNIDFIKKNKIIKIA